MPQLVKNSDFFSVSANGLATLSLPLGMTYERIVLVLGGGAFTKAMITSLVVKVNTREIIKTTGTALDKINKYRGVYDAAGFLTIDFTEPRARDEIGQSLGAITTMEGVNSLTLEVTITGATTPTLASYSVLSAPRKNGVYYQLKEFPMTFSAGGRFPIQLPYGPNGGSIVKRVHFLQSIMTGLEVRMNGMPIHESNTAINEFLQQEYKHVPQSGMYTADWLLDDNHSGALITAVAKSMDWYLTVSGAGVVTCQMEVLAPLGAV